MEQRIVLMTANVQGGIIQFTFQLYHTLKAMGHSVKVCIPWQMHDSDIDEIAEEDRLQYYKEKSVFSKKPYQKIAAQIMETEPEYVWYCDDSVICSNVGLCLQRENVRQLLTLHDAGGYHPTNHESLRSKVLRWYVSWVNRTFYKKVHRFVLLSPECEKTFGSRFPTYLSRAVRMNLGAHIPKDQEKMPSEMTAMAEKPYLLFFGRIDKYKGIGHLLRAYDPVANTALPLVIAGSGMLSDEEKERLSGVKNVTLINRYIQDGEMKWLFSHAAAAVLPYIEATQSGIIPIAYAYGKPVIVSNIPGLTQFVQDGVTGVIAKDIAELSVAIGAMTVDAAEAMSGAVTHYHDEHMDWQHNLKRMFSEI